MSMVKVTEPDRAGWSHYIVRPDHPETLPVTWIVFGPNPDHMSSITIPVQDKDLSALAKALGSVLAKDPLEYAKPVSGPPFHYMIANFPEAVGAGQKCPDLSLCASEGEAREKAHAYWREYVEECESNYDEGDELPEVPFMACLSVLNDGTFRVKEFVFPDRPAWESDDEGQEDA